MASRALGPWTGQRSISPFGRDPLETFRREMDRVIGNVFGPELRSFAPAAESAWPTLDVDETDDAYIVTVEVPGLKDKDVELNLRDNVLTISGEKREERREERQGGAYAERVFGQFRRSIPFTAEVDPEKVEAKFKDGVLTITLPKSAKGQAQGKRIEVKSQ